MKSALAAIAGAVMLSGCGVTAADLPLPGNTVSGDTYLVSAAFDDALNLPIGASVKINGVAIGKVRKVESRDFRAYVEMELMKDHRVHTDTNARLRASTPLGELFVELDDMGAGAPLAKGDVLNATSTAPSIEDTMAATSLLLNGGNLGQLRSIVNEVNMAFDGRDENARNLLTELTITTSSLGESSGDINRMLDALASLSETLNKRETTINSALEELPKTAKVLRDNTDELTKLLTGIKGLGDVSQRVVDQTQDDILQILRKIGPILDELAGLREEFGPGLVDLVRFAELLDRGVPTDYLNTYLYLDDSVRLPGLDGLLVPETPILPGLGLPNLGLPELPLPLPGVGSEGPDIGLGGLLGQPGGGG